MSLAPSMQSWFIRDSASDRPYALADPSIKTGDLMESPTSRETSLPTVLWEIRADKVRLRAVTPIKVEVRMEGRFWFAENETLRVFAHGLTQAVALAEFHEHLVYFYSYYAKLRMDQVIGEATRLKELYAKTFKRA
jgi:hypothetical protein